MSARPPKEVALKKGPATHRVILCPSESCMQARSSEDPRSRNSGKVMVPANQSGVCACPDCGRVLRLTR